MNQHLRLSSDESPTLGGSPDSGCKSDLSLTRLDSGLDDELKPMRGLVIGLTIGTAIWLVAGLIVFIILTA